MGVKKFCALLHEAKFGKNDKVWFPRWIRRYASSVKVSDGDRPGVEDERHLSGRIDPREPAILQQMRKELRLRHKALETERSYVGWVQRFMRHCRSPELQQFGDPEIKAFLTDLAVDGNVASGTQNQAKCALLFLFQVVMGRELAFLDVTRATKPERLPVVLSRKEVGRLLPEFQGLKRLMFLDILVRENDAAITCLRSSLATFSSAPWIGSGL